jgi:hypothetical protein
MATTTNAMCPIDPAETTKNQNESPMSPPFVDDDMNIELIEHGMRIAEDERRDTVTSGYEEEALDSSDTDEELDDISYPKGDGEADSPELSAMKEHRPPASE